jgi:hypothetical protein
MQSLKETKAYVGYLWKHSGQNQLRTCGHGFACPLRVFSCWHSAAREKRKYWKRMEYRCLSFAMHP